ncbi:MAG: DUF805 domain-containing protein [Acidobacteriota bacterium]
MNWFIKAMKQYADFKGRAQRAEYWYFSLFYILIYIAALFIDELLGTQSRHKGGTGLFALLTVVALFMPALAVSARRMHDIGKSGWWLLISLIPIVGSLMFIAFAVRDSQPGGNRFGPNPKQS